MANAKQKERISRAEMIMNTCRNKFNVDPEDAGIPLKVLVSTISLKLGAANRYIKELINDLINVGELILVDGKVYYNGK